MRSLGKHVCLFLMLIALLFSSCRQKDPIVAEVYNATLYQSQVAAQIPDGYPKADSLALAQLLINEWIKEQVILHEAEKELSVKEKNFEKELTDYKNSLLINAFYNHIAQDSSIFEITDDELQAFLRKYESRYTVNREIIKINYVKTSKNSKIINPVKELLFNDERRQSEKNLIEDLCADSIEYFLEDNTWLYLDDIQNEFPIEIKNKESILSQNRFIETEDNDYHYMIVFLDYKSQRSINETEDEISAARMMLTQQKKQAFINQKIEELYSKALKSGKIALPNGR